MKSSLDPIIVGDSFPNIVSWSHHLDSLASLGHEPKHDFHIETKPAPLVGQRIALTKAQRVKRNKIRKQQSLARKKNRK